jgi:hypothetical protein
MRKNYLKNEEAAAKLKEEKPNGWTKKVLLLS